VAVLGALAVPPPLAPRAALPDAVPLSDALALTLSLCSALGGAVALPLALGEGVDVGVCPPPPPGDELGNVLADAEPLAVAPPVGDAAALAV
jgi:hypothetical protein